MQAPNDEGEVDAPAKAHRVTWAQLHILLYPGIANVVSILVQVQHCLDCVISFMCMLTTMGPAASQPVRHAGGLAVIHQPTLLMESKPALHLVCASAVAGRWHHCLGADSGVAACRARA